MSKSCTCTCTNLLGRLIKSFFFHNKLNIFSFFFYLEFNITRSYTPILSSYLPQINCNTPNILLLIKTYLDGSFTKHIPTIKELKLSQPKGNLKLTNLKEHTKFALFAAGSGITPMLSIIDYLLKRKSNKM